MIGIGVVLFAGFCAASPVPTAAAASAAPAADTALARMWRQAQTWAAFEAAIDARVELWRRNIRLAAVPDALLARARGVGSWKLLVVADDDCSDSVNVLPYIAKLAELAPNLEIRIVPDGLGTSVKQAHRAPDGRPAIPTLVVLDAAFNDRGCWVERPAQLQHWFIQRGDSLLDHDTDTYRREKQGFYDFDRGLSTLEEVVGVIEAAAAGTPRCGIAPHP